MKGYLSWLDANIKYYISPPSLPGLSPTENVWSIIMATAVYADHESQWLQALKHRFRKAWRSIFLSTFQILIGLMLTNW